MPAFLKLHGIEGEATDENHQNWIRIDSVSAPIFRNIAEGVKDADRSRGDTTLGDIVIVRSLDKSSVKLAVACARGDCFDTAEIHLCTTSGKKQEPFLTYKLHYAVLTSYSFHGSGSNDPAPTEELTMSYTKVDWNYITFGADQTPSGNVPASYHPATGESK